MMLINDILERILKHIKSESDADIARALKVEPQNVYNWRKRGTIPWPELCTFVIEEKISFDWIFMGKENKNENCEVKCGDKIAQLCKKVKDVVESETHWGASLEANINSFKVGFDNDQKVTRLEKDVIDLKKSIRGSLSDMGPARRGEKKKAI